MCQLFRVAVFCLFWAGSSLHAEGVGTWQARSEQGRHFASVESAQGVQVVLDFEAGKNSSSLFVSGLWPTRPLDLRLYVSYANGKRAYIDTFRFAKVLKTKSGAIAYTMVMPNTQLSPLRGGDVLVIEDLKKRTQVPLTGSAKAIKAAQASATGG